MHLCYMDSFLCYKHLYDAVLQAATENFKTDQVDIKIAGSALEGTLGSGGARQGEMAWKWARVDEWI